MGKTVSVTVRRRGFFGHVFRIVFFAYNILMVIWLFSSMAMFGKSLETTDEAAKVGGAIGTMLGTGFIFMIWFLGAAILGGLMMATRGKLITTTETK